MPRSMSKIGNFLRGEFRDAPGILAGTALGLVAVGALLTPQGEQFANDSIMSGMDNLFGISADTQPTPTIGEYLYGGSAGTDTSRPQQQDCSLLPGILC